MPVDQIAYPRKTMRDFLATALVVVGWIFAILALVVLIAAGAGAEFELKFLHSATRTEATVVEMVEQKGEDTTTFAPVFVFHTPQGQEQKIYSQVSSYPPAYQIGDKIAVFYNPKSPSDAQMATFFNLWGWKVIAGGIGLFDLLLGLVLAFVGSRMKRKASIAA